MILTTTHVTHAIEANLFFGQWQCAYELSVDVPAPAVKWSVTE